MEDGTVQGSARTNGSQNPSGVDDARRRTPPTAKNTTAKNTTVASKAAPSSRPCESPATTDHLGSTAPWKRNIAAIVRSPRTMRRHGGAEPETTAPVGATTPRLDVIAHSGRPLRSASSASNRRPLRTLLPALASLAALSPGAAAAADLWDAARCGTLSIATGAQAGPPGNRHAADWRATLAAPAGEEAGRLHARTLATEGPASLDGLPALVAGATLITLDPDRPHACDLQHAFRQAAIDLGSLAPGATAAERWAGIEAHSHGNDLSLGALRVRVVNAASGQTEVDVEAHSISAAGTDMTAAPIAGATIRLSAPTDRVRAIARGEALRPDDTIHIELVRFSGGDALVEATGIVHPANRSGHLDVRARDMEDLRDALPAGERSRAGAAFLVLRLAADKDADGTLHWDVAWEDRLVRVNGVPLPLSY